MRTFDYRHLPSNLFDGEVGNLNVRLYEDKGKLDALEGLQSARLEKLRGSVHADNVNMSTRIEGIYIDPRRVAELAAGAAPDSEDEAQVAGYAQALKLVEEHADELELSAATAVKLYETLFAHRDFGRSSRYRKKDYLYVQVDGHMQAMPVSPITAFETPLVLGAACDSLADAFDAHSCSPLILAAVFTVDFLCIRPFDEGNGRIARLFSALLLHKAGFKIGAYSSVDKLIERDAMAYYDALNACVDGWDRCANDYTPYTLYWFGKLHDAHTGLFSTLEAMTVGSGGAGSKSERVVAFVSQASAPVSKREILTALPDVSEATVEAVLGKLVRSKTVQKLGASRATRYQWAATDAAGNDT